MFPGGGLHRSRLDYSDSYVPDCWPPSAGARVPPVGTTVHCARLDYSDFGVPDCVPELLESVRDTEESLLVAGDVALPEMSPVMFAGTAAVPVSLPAVAGDIVDRCRMWESHADLEDQGGWYPSPRWSLPIYMINDGGNAGHNLLGRPIILPRRPRNCWNHCCNICCLHQWCHHRRSLQSLQSWNF